jgi:hypothetical protein
MYHRCFSCVAVVAPSPVVAGGSLTCLHVRTNVMITMVGAYVRYPTEIRAIPYCFHSIEILTKYTDLGTVAAADERTI